ncbi:MAG: hypothetical protein WD794_07745 [Mycobacteriales bacterium]
MTEHGDAGADPALRLRAAVQALRAPEAAKRAPAPRSSVFGRAAAAVPADTHPPADRSVLQARIRTVETSALLPGTTLALLVVPNALVAADLAASCAQLVRGGATVVVLGPDLPRAVTDRRRPLTVPLRSDDSLSQEWGLLACGPARRVAFLARREEGEHDLWRWLVTRDSVAVNRSGTAILDRVPFLRLRVPTLTS